MTAPTASPANPASRLVLLAIGGIGVSAVMTQLALIRELLSAFSGNELVFGIGLGSWLLLTGAGAWLGRLFARQDRSRKIGLSVVTTDGDASSPGIPEPGEGRSLRTDDGSGGAPIGVFVVGLILAAILPLMQVVAVRVLRDVVFLRGSAVGVTGTVLGSLCLLLPFCVVSGAMLTLACALVARCAGMSAVGRVYIADSLGSIVGGILFSFVLVPWFDHFALLCFPAVINLLSAVVIAWQHHRRMLVASSVIVAAGLAAHVALINADDITTAVQHWGQPIRYRGNSPYGRLVVTENAGQLTFFENGIPVISTQNIDQVEESVHYAMSQRPAARKVLLLSGGVAGTAREILRYGVAEVTYVEIDPLIITAGRRFLPDNLADARIKTVATDGRRFVQQTAERFEVVIVDVPDPSTSQLNRFYTAEFFGEIRRVLARDGVVAIALGHYENYVSPELGKLLASAYRTLQQSFAHVQMIPGGRVFFLASDGPLTLDIAARIEQRGLATKLVNRHYLDAMLAPDRIADLTRAIAQPADINTDFSPALYYYYLRHWLSQFAFRTGSLAGVLVILLTVYLLRLRAVPRMILASGFAASALEVVLLLGFQALYGSLYQQVGLVVTVFMAGLAAGAGRAQHRLQSGTEPTPTRSGARGASRSTVVLGLAVAALAGLLPLILPQLGRLDAIAGSSLAGQGVTLVLTFLLASLVGAQFPLAAAAEAGDPAGTAARLYAADLVGAAAGALFVSTLLIPLIGMWAVCLLTAGLNLGTALVAWRTTTPA